MGLSVGLLLATASSTVAAQEACSIEPSPAALVGAPEQVLGRARAAHEAKHFVEAAGLFRALAKSHPDLELGRNAVLQEIDSMNAAGSDVSGGCVATMASDIHTFREIYCAPPIKPDNVETCAKLHRISGDLVRIEIEHLVSAADKAKPAVARKMFKEAGQRYASMWDDELKDACRHRRDECARSDEVLFNAARAFRAARSLGDALIVRAWLLDPTYGLQNTTLGRQAAIDQANDWLSIAEYDRAADLFERFVAESPKDEHARDSIENAFVLRVSLGDIGRAEKNVDTFQKLFGAKDPKRSASIVVAFARDLAQKKRYSEVERALESRASIVGKGEQEERFLARASLGQAQAALGEEAKADETLRGVAAARWSDVVAPSVPSIDPSIDPRVVRVIVAIGRAKAHFAEKIRDEALKLKVVKGSALSLEKKLAAVKRAEAAYEAIVALDTATEPVAPIAPVLSAAREIARLRSQLWAQIYLAEGAARAESYERAAIEANEKCLRLVVAYESPGEEAQACGSWLERHDPAHFKPLREIAPKAHWVGSGSPSLPEPLERDGEPEAPPPVE